jgi:hypothetical protein
MVTTPTIEGAQVEVRRASDGAGSEGQPVPEVYSREPETRE